ncbi:MAG: nucleoside-triphosphatase [Elusimicrobiales bacterium]
MSSGGTAASSRLVFAFSDCALKDRLSARLAADYGRWLAGFRTQERRAGGARDGFDVEALGGAREVLASRSVVSSEAFNKYGLNTAALERTALPALEAGAAAGKILLFDELGPMASRSEKFSARAVELLFSGRPCLVFYRRGAAAFEAAFARMDDTAILELSAGTWAEAVAAARAWLDYKVKLMETQR